MWEESWFRSIINEGIKDLKNLNIYRMIETIPLIKGIYSVHYMKRHNLRTDESLQNHSVFKVVNLDNFSVN